MIVRQVRLAFQIFDFFAERRSPATVSEIADHFGWPRSSTFNLVETLSDVGLLHEPRQRHAYYPTHRLLTLANEIVSADALPVPIRDLVETTAARTGETVAVAGLSWTSAVFLHVVEASHPIRYSARTGQRVPLHATASGRALLSLLPDRERASVLSKVTYERFAPETLMSAEAVEAEIAESRGRGWFLNRNGYAPELLGIAIPLPLADRKFCLLVAGPIYRMGSKVYELAAKMQEEIERMSSRRGRERAVRAPM